jgi:hypothetical protein
LEYLFYIVAITWLLFNRGKYQFSNGADLFRLYSAGGKATTKLMLS